MGKLITRAAEPKVRRYKVFQFEHEPNHRIARNVSKRGLFRGYSLIRTLQHEMGECQASSAINQKQMEQKQRPVLLTIWICIQETHCTALHCVNRYNYNHYYSTIVAHVRLRSPPPSVVQQPELHRIIDHKHRWWCPLMATIIIL